MPIDVVHWNPRARLGRRPMVNKVRRLRRTNNFGDLLGPVIVGEIVRRRGLAEPADTRRLLAVGSIMSLARDHDVVWGIGVNGKSLGSTLPFDDIDARAVRGPLTRAVLLDHGVSVPAVYGDPGLLVGHLWSREDLAAGHHKRDVTIVPNLHDLPRMACDPRTIDPTGALWDVLGAIAASDFVIGSSLHGIVVAESLGIPARLVRSSTEPLFKYEDYFRGTGRGAPTPAVTNEEAVRLGGELPPDWDATPLLDAFPADLWPNPDA